MLFFILASDVLVRVSRARRSAMRRASQSRERAREPRIHHRRHRHRRQRDDADPARGDRRTRGREERRPQPRHRGHDADRRRSPASRSPSSYRRCLGDSAPWLGVVGAALAGAASSMLFGVLVLTLGSNQVATGLALTIFGTGLSSLIGAGYVGMAIAPFDQSFPTRSPAIRSAGCCSATARWSISRFIMVFAVGWFLNRTRAGLVLRAVGENDLSAHSIGYSVIGDPLRRDRLRRRDGGNRRRLFLDGDHADVGGADDGGARLDRARAGRLLGLARRAAARRRLFLRHVHDA